jgi:hypothetical protein
MKQSKEEMKETIKKLTKLFHDSCTKLDDDKIKYTIKRWILGNITAP